MDETLSDSLAERELKEIDAILPSLLKEDLITDIECRIIVGYNRLIAKQGAVYKVIMSKTKEEAEHLFEIFRTLTVTIHAGELTKRRRDCQDELENNLPLDKQNPLLNSIVLARLFRYLPLDYIKDSRLLCREWNSTAEIFLRKRSAIQFRSDVLRPQTFMKISKYSLPDLPFPAYKFSDVENNMWSTNVLEHFFDKWGKNIQEVEFDDLVLLSEEGWGCLEFYDVTPWFEKMSNLCFLKMKSLGDKYTKTLRHISIDKLANIKTVYLENCRILTNGERVTFLTFSNVSLIDVSFQRLGNVEVLQDFCYNDIFDFSHSTHLFLSNGEQKNIELDMEGQIFNHIWLYLRFVTLKNWVTAKGDIYLLRLCGSNFTEKNQLNINILQLEHLEVDLAVLPQTLEIISFGEEVNIVCEESVQLPNLKHLLWKAKGDNSSMLTHFANCPNLTELYLFCKEEEISGLTLYSDCIPRSIKKLRIYGGMKLEFANGDHILQLDTLLLERMKYFSDCKTILEKIKPNVLVLSYYKWNEPIDLSDIVEIILANKQTIIVGTAEEDFGLHEKTPFEGSAFSSYVDKKSNYYKFENQFGHAIERKEFQDLRTVSDIESDLHDRGLGDLYEIVRKNLIS